ncbi:all-trans-retinol 13,14-reductase [Aureococcus anophagefferens]|nr:all-trans-retinol 13,14-reductase [Aureococcus anophagefferens]
MRLAIIATLVATPAALVRPQQRAPSLTTWWGRAAEQQRRAAPEHFDAVVLVVEAHDHAGGCAHEYEVDGFRFENGPSLYAGLSPAASPNPLKHVFQIIGEEPSWITYDRWGTAFPEGTFAAAVGGEDFRERILPTYGGPGAADQFERLMKRVEPSVLWP